MSQRKYPKIEDILGELSTELEQRGFLAINVEQREIVRYAKRESYRFSSGN